MFPPARAGAPQHRPGRALRQLEVPPPQSVQHPGLGRLPLLQLAALDGLDGVGDVEQQLRDLEAAQGDLSTD